MIGCLVVFPKANRVGGNDIVYNVYSIVVGRDHKEQHKVSVTLVLVFQKMRKSSKNNQHQHFIPCLRRFPPNPRPRPRPCLLFCSSTAALASRSRWTAPMWPFPAARCSGVKPQSPQRKEHEKILAPQSHSNSPWN